MNFKDNIKSVLIEIICVLFIALFVYAALSKLLDFENFQVQLGQSPLLNPFAGEISWTVPLLEIITAVLLCIPKFRKVGLMICFILMVLFTAYIYFILNFSEFVPCSCGGILEKMGWKEHFIFNVFFIVLADAGILLLLVQENKTSKQILLMGFVLIIIGSASLGTMEILLKMSENKRFKRNNFVRMFPPVAVKKETVYDLKYNSYYLSGTNKNAVYLGNTTAPLFVLELDSMLKKSSKHYIALPNRNVKLQALHLNVRDGYFYLIDGAVPVVFRGNTQDWRGHLKMINTTKFSVATVIDSALIAFRALSDKSNENVLGIIDFSNKEKVKLKYHPELLQKQFDGVFDIDGAMHYSQMLKSFVYVYYYRNEFIVTDDNLNLAYRGNTIDTTSKAKIKVLQVKSKDEKKLGASTVMVNRSSAVYRNLLFVNSSVPGKYEPLVMWKDASIIDVYDIRTRLYLMSFYIYNENRKQLSTFTVAGNRLYALIGNSIVSYRLGSTIQNYMNQNKE